MNYLAFGDSISIDDYTGVPGGGAASQFAQLIGAEEFQNLTHDGCTTVGVIERLDLVTIRPDVITLTAGGNDFLQGAWWGAEETFRPSSDPLSDVLRGTLAGLDRIAERLAGYACPVIANTVYDPTDGDDSLSADLDVPASFRPYFNALNDGIRLLAKEHGFLLSDLERLFHGHGITAKESWFVLGIEPNLAGASAMAHHWHSLFQERPR